MKRADLHSIAEKLVDEYVASRVEIRHDAARESYKLERVRASTVDEFLERITDYWRHHFRCTIGSAAEWTDELARGWARATVEKAFHGGFAEAFYNARMGVGGGLRGVLDRMAEQCKREARESWQGVLYADVWNSLDVDRLINLAEQVVSGGGELTVGWHMVADKLRAYIEDYAERLSRTRRASISALRW